MRGFLVILILMSIILLFGCTRTVYIDRPVEVKVEVYKPCIQTSDIPANPTYALSLLNSRDSDGEVILAMKQEIEERKNFIDILTEILRSCTE
jgi:hypothetical protein